MLTKFYKQLPDEQFEEIFCDPSSEINTNFRPQPGDAIMIPSIKAQKPGDDGGTPKDQPRKISLGDMDQGNIISGTVTNICWRLRIGSEDIVRVVIIKPDNEE